jgi:hypothetical protein
MVIAASNPETDELERSYLIQAYSAGATALKVQNNDRVLVNSRILIGHMGHEGSEIVTVSAQNTTDNQSLTVGATKFPHSIDDPVFVLRFDQVKFYRSTTGKTGTYTLLTTVDMDIDNDQLATYYDDTAGLTTYYYKSALYHSVSTLEAAQSDPVGGGGYARGEVGRFIDEFLKEIGDPDDSQGLRDQVLTWINDCSDDLLLRTKRPYTFLKTRTVLGTTAGLETIDLPTNLWKFDDFEYIYTPDSDTNIDYPVRRIPYEEFRRKTENNNADNSDKLQLITIDEAVNKFRLYPTPLTSQPGVIYLYFWTKFATIDSEGDTFQTPTPRPYKMYCLEAYTRQKSRTDATQIPLATSYQSKYEAEVSRLPRSKQFDSGSPKGLRFGPQTYRGNRRY